MSSSAQPIISWTRHVDRSANCINKGCGNTVFVFVEYSLLVLDSKTGELQERRQNGDSALLCAECLGRKLAFHFYNGSATEGKL